MIRQAADMAVALRSAGGSVETIELPGCDHLGTSVPTGDPNSAWMARTQDFLRT